MYRRYFPKAPDLPGDSDAAKPKDAQPKDPFLAVDMSTIAFEKPNVPKRVLNINPEMGIGTSRNAILSSLICRCQNSTQCQSQCQCQCPSQCQCQCQCQYACQYACQCKCVAHTNATVCSCLCKTLPLLKFACRDVATQPNGPLRVTMAATD